MVESLNAEIDGLQNKIAGMAQRIATRESKKSAKKEQFSPDGSLSRKELE